VDDLETLWQHRDDLTLLLFNVINVIRVLVWRQVDIQTRASAQIYTHTHTHAHTHAHTHTHTCTHHTRIHTHTYTHTHMDLLFHTNLNNTYMLNPFGQKNHYPFSVSITSTHTPVCVKLRFCRIIPENHSGHLCCCCCSVLLYAAVYNFVLLCLLQCVAVCSSVQFCAAVCCNMLQSAVVCCCSVLQQCTAAM